MPGRRILSAEQLDEMAELVERGWSSSRIAAHFTAAGTPVGRSCIHWQSLRIGADRPARLRRATNEAPKPYSRAGRVVRPFTPEEDAQLRALDMAGVSLNEMGRRLQRPHNSCAGRLMTLARRDARAEEAAQ